MKSSSASSPRHNNGVRGRSPSPEATKSALAATPTEPVAAKPPKDLSKALVLRSPRKRSRSPSPTSDRTAPLLSKRRATDQTDFDAEMAALPDHCPTETYASMPIQDFGLAMLRSMGWKEGDGIGRNKRGTEVKPIQYIPRPGRLGLGAQPAPDTLPPTLSRDGTKRRRKHVEGPVYELPVTADGKVKHYISVDEEFKVRKSLQVKSLVLVTRGRHQGMLGVVKELMYNKEVARIELAANGDWVKVEATDLKVLDDSEYDEEMAKRHRQARASAAAATEPTSSTSKVWVRPGLLVRIIAKSLDGGRHYLRKARVIDVLPGGVCVLEVDDSRRTLLDRVPQDDLETVVPSVRDPVCIVYLPRKLRQDKPYLLGMRGEVTDKDKKNQEVVVMTVEDEVVVCHFDHVCAVASGGR